jgi:hypothetical protein
MANTEVLNSGTDRRDVTRSFSNVRNTSIIGVEDQRSTANTANALILDFSSSMSDSVGMNDNRSKCAGVQESATQFVVNSPVTSYSTIICFSSSASILYKMAQIGQNRLNLIKAIQSQRPCGTTAMLEGLKLAEKQFKSVPKHMIRRTYVFTDGIPDRDPSSFAKRLIKQGVTLHTIGFGSGNQIDENLLRNMASISPAGVPLYNHFEDTASLTGFMKRQSKIL